MPTWKPSWRPKAVRFIEHFVLGQNVAGEPTAPELGDLPLGEIDRFTIQRQVNWLAGRFSKSVVLKFKVYAHSILDEAFEQEFITKDPARKIEAPQTRRQCTRTLSEDEIVELLKDLAERDRLVVRMFVELGRALVNSSRSAETTASSRVNCASTKASRRTPRRRSCGRSENEGQSGLRVAPAVDRKRLGMLA